MSETKKTVLFLSGEPFSVKLVSDILQPEDICVLVASGEKEAFDLIAQATPDIVFFDVATLDPEGYELCARIKGAVATKHIPVLIATLPDDKEARAKGLQAGCDDLISKPFYKDELLPRIRSLMEIKFLRDELRENYRKLRDMESLKRGLTSMVVHDIKSPLASIALRLEMLLMDEGDTLSIDQTSEVRVALLAAQQIENMINNILDIGKMEARKLDMNCEAVDIADLVGEVLRLLKPKAQYEKIRLKLDLAESISTLNADKVLLKRMLINLVNNAIKFAENRVLVSVKISDGNNGVVFSISDDGPGIPEDFRRKVFDKFVQVKHGDAIHGHGLGLAFCKMATTAHGGTIWVDAGIDDKGSSFKFFIPFA